MSKNGKNDKIVKNGKNDQKVKNGKNDQNGQKWQK